MRKFLFALVLVAAAAAPQAAEAQATARVIHAISGEALGLDPELPVDIRVNGSLFLTDVRFLDFTDPVELPAGDYDITIHLAGSDPFATPPVLRLETALQNGDDVHLIAHFTPGPGIALSAFANNDAPAIAEPLSTRISTRDLRLTVRHAADFGRVAINRLVPFLEPTLANGEGLSLELDEARYRFWLSRAGAPRPLGFEPTAIVDLEAGLHYFVYAVGSPADGSFQLLVIADPLG
ncbi:MAG TPA: DUF4397 domain-containing protein [Chondromyces sp.]|nr:DUF4397 domain-containing protein [Chondromyces sp.]